MARWSIVPLLTLVSLAAGYNMFQSSIPNGDSVPHPCNSDIIWSGVGHENQLGGGARNPFGVAFKAASTVWTTALCEADSDGDGMTNGEELGDPDCLWSANSGNPPARTTDLTHPGICEPTNSTECKALNAWEISCYDDSAFECAGTNGSDPDMITVRRTFDETLVPAQETTFMCQKFTFPDDQEYHLIASEPVIANRDVMHHTVIYGCPNGIDGFETPQPCGMASQICTVGLGGWAVGGTGQCSHSDTGVQCGKGHFNTIVIEHHWNNPRLVEDYVDSSGQLFYLTPNLRPYNLATLTLGQTALAISPNKTSTTFESVCSSKCTKRKLEETVYITQASIHMHYLGSSGSIELWRHGVKAKDLIQANPYSYETPEYQDFEDPVELRAGDELRTSCTYDSSGRDEITYFGEATADEMCFGFLNYYPAEAKFDLCVSYEEADICAIEDYYDWLKGGATSVHLSLAVAGLTLLATALQA